MAMSHSARATVAVHRRPHVRVHALRAPQAPTVDCDSQSFRLTAIILDRTDPLDQPGRWQARCWRSAAAYPSHSGEFEQWSKLVEAYLPEAIRS